MAELEGNCGICGRYDKELTHLDLYVNGSGGIWACLKCRIALTEMARSMQSLASRARFPGGVKFKQAKRRVGCKHSGNGPACEKCLPRRPGGH